jgi:hypothetical protein
MAHVCNTSYLGGRDKRILSSRSPWEKLMRLYLRNKSKNKTKTKRAGGIGQVVE